MPVRCGYHHVALRVRDLDRTIEFYARLGCSLVREWGEGEHRACMVDVGGGSLLEIFAGGTGEAEVFPKYEHIALRSEDPDADFENAVKAGARPRNMPKDAKIGGVYPVRIAFVYGPDDEVIEFFKEL